MILAKKNRTAMTFVEIIIAGLLMIVVFIIGWTISTSFTGVKKVRNYETAVFLANQAIEAVRAARSRELGSDNDKRKNTLIADFSSATNIFDHKNGEGFVPVIEIGGIEYKRKISIVDIPSSNKSISPELKLIKVLVSWKARDDGKPIHFEVVTAHCEQW
jgi:cytoskeletal protein RodZ